MNRGDMNDMNDDILFCIGVVEIAINKVKTYNDTHGQYYTGTHLETLSVE